VDLFEQAVRKNNISNIYIYDNYICCFPLKFYRWVCAHIYIIAIGSHDVLHVQVAAPQKLLEANGKQGPGLNPGLQRIRAQSSGFLEWAMA